MPQTQSPEPWRPRWIPLLVALILIAFFIRLGIWQLSRADEKRGIMAAAENAPALIYSELSEPPQRYAEIAFSGRFDTQRHFLLDNQVLKGRPGVHVWTPFKTEDGDWLLVNRGWLPLTPDRRLPDIHTPDDVLTLQGRVNQAPRVGKRLGGGDTLSTVEWPQLITYLDLSPIAAVLDVRLPKWIVQLDADSPGGFSGRDWPVVNFGPKKHLSYAWTWFSLALAVFIVTVIVQRPRPIKANLKSPSPHDRSDSE